VTDGQSVTATVNIAPINNFTGTVNFTCSGLPAGSLCSFSPSQLTGAGSTPSSTQVTITTNKVASNQPSLGRGVALALLLPFAGLLGLRRRTSVGLRLLAVAFAALLSLGVTAGCTNVFDPTTAPTPTGTSQVSIGASSGGVSQSTTFGLTVQ